MKALILKPFLALQYFFRLTGVLFCLLLIQLSNTVLYRLLFGRRDKRAEQPDGLNLPRVSVPELGKKLQESFR